MARRMDPKFAADVADAVELVAETGETEFLAMADRGELVWRRMPEKGKMALATKGKMNDIRVVVTLGTMEIDVYV